MCIVGHMFGGCISSIGVDWLVSAFLLGAIELLGGCLAWKYIYLYTAPSANYILSLGASRSVWEDVECKLRSVNFRRVLDPRRAFWPALGVTGISDDGYRSTMGVIVISLGTPPSTTENFGCTLESRQTNGGITSKLWEIPGFLWTFIQRIAGVFWDSLDVHEQSISLNREYDAWIIVRYHFWNIPAIIVLNIVCFGSLH
jgi:hypothetical protein